MKVKERVIQNKFTKYDDTFECIADNGQRRIYKRTDNDNPDNWYYEVVKPRPIPGTNQYRYPSSSDWGVYGKTLRKNEFSRAKELFEAGW